MTPEHKALVARLRDTPPLYGLYAEAADAIEALAAERNGWKAAAKSAGVCMSCTVGSREPCTDCLGTGWNNGNDPFARAEAAEAKLAALQKGATMRFVASKPKDTP